MVLGGFEFKKWKKSWGTEEFIGWQKTSHHKSATQLGGGGKELTKSVRIRWIEWMVQEY